MTQKKENPALWVTDKAKNCKYVGCDIEGVKDEGQGTLMLRTRIFNFRKKHPTLWTSTLISLFTIIFGGVILLLIEYGYFVK